METTSDDPAGGSTTPQGSFGVGNIKFPAMRLAKPTGSQSHLAVAEEFLHGAALLAAANDPTILRAHALLCSFALETALKAFLSGAISEGAVRGLGHDLSAAWKCAAAHGLPLGPRMPQWFKTLARLHWKKKGEQKFLIRYPEVKHGFSWPDTHAMTDGISAILKMVRTNRKR